MDWPAAELRGVPGRPEAHSTQLPAARALGSYGTAPGQTAAVQQCWRAVKCGARQAQPATEDADIKCTLT